MQQIRQKISSHSEVAGSCVGIGVYKGGRVEASSLYATFLEVGKCYVVSLGCSVRPFIFLGDMSSFDECMP